MIQKAQYQEPQSEIILLSAPVLLQEASEQNEHYVKEGGSWAPYDI